MAMWWLGCSARPELARDIERQFTDSVGSDRDPQPWLVEVLKRAGAPTVEAVGREPAENFLAMVGLALEGPDLALAIEKYEAARKSSVPAFAVEYLRARQKIRMEEARAVPAPLDPALRDRIESMYREDQRVRQPEAADFSGMAAMDAKHEPLLEAMLREFGVPTYEVAGRDAAHQFVTMLQHMPTRLRDRALPLLKKNVEAGQASAIDYAMELDRTETDHGRPQVYGENFQCGPDKKFVPFPIKDVDGLAERRAKLGLEPIGSKTRLMRIIYGDSFCK